MPLERRDIHVQELRLDPTNPRLPEDLQGVDQGRLLEYLYDNGALDELIRSLADNGYFEHEPMIVVEEDDAVAVLEGNRRLCALLILLREPVAIEQGIEPVLEEPPSAERLEELRLVPCVVVGDRDEVHKYLGFRHIGGIKKWSAEAKARYLLIETDREAERGSEHPFLVVARRVGSNVQGVRNSYTALLLLRKGRDEHGIPVDHVARRRFGVWLRCMNSTDIREYLGLDSPRSYTEVREAAEEASGENLREVIADLSPREERPPLISDSREVTIYGQILRNEAARTALRQYGELAISKQIVQLAELPSRLRTIRSQIEIAQEEAQLAEPTEELAEAAERLAATARALRATVRDRLEDAEGD